MIEVIRAVRSKRSSIEEQFGKQAQFGRHSYADLSSIAMDHGLDYYGATFKQILGRYSLEVAYFGRNNPVDQSEAIDKMLENLKSKGYDIMETDLPFHHMTIRGKIIGRSHHSGDLALKERPRPLIMVSDTGIQFPVIRQYEGNLVASIGYTGRTVIIGLYIDDVAHTEIIENLGKIAFGSVSSSNPETSRSPSDQTLEELLGDIDTSGL